MILRKYDYNREDVYLSNVFDAIDKMYPEVGENINILREKFEKLNNYYMEVILSDGTSLNLYKAMGGLLMEKKSNEIRTKHNKLHVGNRAELKGCPVAKVTHKKKDDYMTSLEFTEGVYNQPIKMVTIYFQDGSIRNETPLTEANIES